MASDYSKIFKLQNKETYCCSPNKKLKTSKTFPNIYLTEDQTQLRCKQLNSVKTKCGDKFVMCHPYNGKIRMKDCGKEEQNWIIVSSPEDLFKLNTDINFKMLDYQPSFINSDDLIVEEA